MRDRDCENVARTTCVLALMAVLALSLCKPQVVSAQGNVNYGMFGNRPLGQPLVPGQSTFGGGVQTSRSGRFLYIGRTDGSAMFATPWRQIEVNVLRQAALAAAQPAQNVVVTPPSPAPQYNVPQPAISPDFIAGLLSETGGGGGMNAAEQPLGMPPGIGPPAAPRVPVPQVGAEATSASPRGVQPFTRSPELSDRMTRLARQGHARRSGH